MAPLRRCWPLLLAVLLSGCGGGDPGAPADAAQLRSLHALMVEIRADLAAARVAEARAGLPALRRLGHGLTASQQRSVERLTALVETEWRCARQWRCDD
ncbi:hypothetical protein [Marichromatium sp. AB31]|uniref:hypothetical protein n=1 Tax=Marichromatium sp. AB31 TaxID=2483362 RepID=UPI000F3D2CC5|nr:hypothetical protein [Marichromatium sp. AB31]RNE91684.1 hypothetical protein EBL84_03650 [Marichromatium sp. AB31]